MIESLSNLIQTAVLGLCLFLSLIQFIRRKERAWALLTLYYTSTFLGTLYWQLYLLFYHRVPYFYTSEMSWYTAYLFLCLLLHQVAQPGERQYRRRAMWLIPLFTGGMMVFYMLRGQIVSNLVAALLMTQLLWCALRGLLWQRDGPDRAAGNRALYTATLLFCMAEYATWTASCYEGAVVDTLLSPFIWCDVLLTLSDLLFLPALRKAVDG